MEMTLVEKRCQFLIKIFNALFGELELGLEPFIKMIFQNRTTVEKKQKKYLNASLRHQRLQHDIFNDFHKKRIKPNDLFVDI